MVSTATEVPMRELRKGDVCKFNVVNGSDAGDFEVPPIVSIRRALGYVHALLEDASTICGPEGRLVRVIRDA